MAMSASNVRRQMSNVSKSIGLKVSLEPADLNPL